MKELFQYIGIIAVTVILIVGAATKFMPLTEDLRVVEPKPGVECAIARRLAIVSIACWKKKEELLIERTEEIVPPSIVGEFTIEEALPAYTFEAPIHSAISVKCGEGEIVVDHGTGEATFTEGCDPSKASKALWEGIKSFFDIEIRGGER